LPDYGWAWGEKSWRGDGTENEVAKKEIYAAINIKEEKQLILIITMLYYRTCFVSLYTDK